MLNEKEKNLRIGLNINGVPNSSYILSWIITCILISFFLSIYTITLAKIFVFDVWSQTPYLMLFIAYFTYILCLISLGFLVVTTIKRTKTANSVGFALILFTIVLTMLFFNSKPLRYV